MSKIMLGSFLTHPETLNFFDNNNIDYRFIIGPYYRGQMIRLYVKLVRYHSSYKTMYLTCAQYNVVCNDVMLWIGADSTNFTYRTVRLGLLHFPIPIMSQN